MTIRRRASTSVRRARPAFRAGCVAAWALWLAGCQTLTLTSTDIEPPPADAVAVEETAPIEPATEPVDPALVEDFRRWLDQDAWQVDPHWSVVDPRGPWPNRPWRWVFHPLDNPTAPPKGPTKPVADGRWDWLWRGDVTDVTTGDLHAAKAALKLAWADLGRSGMNAAILLARLPSDEDTSTLDTLRTICESGRASPQVVKAGASIDAAPTTNPVRLNVPMRCAAAETWCVLLADAEPVDEARLLPAGRLLQTPGLPDELRGTLWRALAKWLPPDRLPMLSETCTGLDQTPGSATGLQRAALEACVIAAGRRRVAPMSAATFEAELWPPALDRARRHGDANIRKLYGRWLAFSGQPEALSILTAQRRDTDPLVRDGAILSLGLSAQPQAREQLEQLARTGGDWERATAVEALSAWGATAVMPFATAETPAVRVAVARGLLTAADAAGDRVLRQLLTDRHPDVQAAALATARQWPREWAGPALLEALRGSTHANRQQALLALRELTQEEISIPVDGLPEDRDAAVRQWAASHGWRVGGAIDGLATTTDSTHDPSSVLAALDDILKAAATTTNGAAWDHLLTQARPADVPAIERVLLDSRSPAAETVRHDLLPRLDDSYAALRDLSDGAVERRREAARRLVAISRRRSLSPAVLRSLHAALMVEQDQFVWQQCLEAVQADGHDEAAQLALLAVHHTWPDIRRLGVAYVALHPTPEAAGWLLPLFRDESRTVQQAAIAAAGKCGNPVVLDGYPSADGSGPAGMRTLLPGADHELRWTLLETMATLRDDQAAAELIRLSYDSHPRVREKAAAVMGATGDRQFVESLIRWSWTESADPVKQAILTSLEALTPPEDRPGPPAGLAAPPTIDDKIKQWAAWWEHHAPRTDAAPRLTADPESRPPS